MYFSKVLIGLAWSAGALTAIVGAQEGKCYNRCPIDVACPSGFVSKPGARCGGSVCRQSDCCEKSSPAECLTCDNFKCRSGTTLKSKPETRLCVDGECKNAFCCAKNTPPPPPPPPTPRRCASWTCGPGLRKKSNPFGRQCLRRGCDDFTCCVPRTPPAPPTPQTCDAARFACPINARRRPGNSRCSPGGCVPADCCEPPVMFVGDCDAAKDTPGCNGKISGFAFRYVGGSCASSTPGLNKFDCDDNGPAAACRAVTVTFSGKKSSGRISYTTSTPNPEDDMIVVNAGDEVGSESTVTVSCDGALVQTLEIHTSCSAAVTQGDKYGSLLLVTPFFDDGGPTCPIGRPVGFP